jgi:hypothetical protein
MSLRYKAKINLGIISIDLNNTQNSYKIVVSEDSSVPSYLMYGPQQPVDVLKKISDKYLKVDSEWLDIKFLGVTNRKIEKGYELNLNHGVMIPDDIDLKHGQWVTISDYFQSNENQISQIQDYHDIIQNLNLITH